MYDWSAFATSTHVYWILIRFQAYVLTNDIFPNIPLNPLFSSFLNIWKESFWENFNISQNNIINVEFAYVPWYAFRGMFSFQWLCHGLLSELQILDDLFCSLYSFTPGLPPALIAYKKKIQVMGLFHRPIREKECSYYVHSQKLKYYVMFPLFSTYVNYDVMILFFRSLWGEIALRMFHDFYEKKVVCKIFRMSTIMT